MKAFGRDKCTLNDLGTNHLLIIGVDRYTNGIPPLYNAVRDAKSVERVLLEKYKFKVSNCKSLYDLDVTRKAIIKEFKNLVDSLSEKDNLLIYFAGHGHYDKNMNEGYWVLSDAVLGECDTYLSDLRIRNMIANVKAKHVFAVIDSCFSGAIFRGIYKVSGNYKIQSRFIATSGRLEIIPDGPPNQHSPFCASFLDVLENSTTEVNWVGDICRALTRNEKINEAEQLPRAEPMQQLGHKGGEYALIKKSFTVNGDDDELDSRSVEKINKRKEKEIRYTLSADVIYQNTFHEKIENLDLSTRINK